MKFSNIAHKIGDPGGMGRGKGVVRAPFCLLLRAPMPTYTNMDRKNNY